MINMSVGEPQGAARLRSPMIANDEIDGCCGTAIRPTRAFPIFQRRHRRMAEPTLPPARGRLPIRCSSRSRPPAARKASTSFPPWRRGAEGGPGNRRGAAQPGLSGLSRRRCCRAPDLAGQRQSETGLPDFDAVDEATWKRMSVVGALTRTANRAGRHRADIDYLTEAAGQAAASTTPCWQSTNATPRSTTREPAAKRLQLDAGDGHGLTARAPVRQSRRPTTRSPSAPTPLACVPASWRAIRGWWR